MSDPRDDVLQDMTRRLDAMSFHQLLGLVVGHLARRVVFSTDTADAWLEHELGVPDWDSESYQFDLIRDAVVDPEDVR